MLPTPRLYARFPFFNLMNSVDGFGELMLRPSDVVAAPFRRSFARLADGNDLWYQGGGAFQPATFGYVGLPRREVRRGRATWYDASADIILTPRIVVPGITDLPPGVRQRR